MNSPMHDPIIDAAQRARLEQIQRRRNGTSPPAPAPTRRTGRRPHAAQGSRIAAAGFGVATMLGLVGVMGLANRPTSADAAPDGTSTENSTDRPVLVVIHTVNADGTVTELTDTSAPAGESRATNDSTTSTATASTGTKKRSTTTTTTATPVVKKKTTTTVKPTVKTVTTKTTTKKATSSGSK